MTGHPEAIRPSLGEFETCPDWVPAMDTGQRSARISLKTVHVHAFEHNAKSVAKVRNVSRLGSHQKSPIRIFRFRATPIQHSNLLYRKPCPSTRFRAIFGGRRL